MTDETSSTHPDPSTSKIDTITYSAGTDVGMRREENQDSYGIMLGEGYRLFIVADGMGGVKGGSIASNLAIAVVERHLRDRSFLTADNIVDALAIANEEVFKRGNSEASLNGMGTTFVALFVTPQGVYTIHVGDSRAYHISKGKIIQLTEDHTLVQELVLSGAITSEQAEHHPVAHMLTRSIGPADTVEIDCNLMQQPVATGDRFLLCSDGLYNLVTEDEIAEICGDFSTDDAVQSLIDLANERGGTDNITIIIADTAQYSVLIPTAPIPSPEKKYHVRYSQEDMIATAAAAVAAQGVSNQKSVGDSSVYPTLGSRSAVTGYHETSQVRNSSEEGNHSTSISDPINIYAPKQISTVSVLANGKDTENHFTSDQQKIDPQTDFSSAEVPEVMDESLIQHKPLESGLRVSEGMQRFYILVGIGFIGGLLASSLFFLSSTHTNRRVNEAVDIPSKMTLEETVPTSKGVSSSTELILTPPLRDLSSGSVVNAPPTTRELLSHETIKFGPAERSSILKRKRDLELSLKDIDVRLALLRADRPTEAENLQRTSAHRAEELATKIDQLRTDIEIAIRQLATWYDRKRRLDSSDRVSMASELAPTVSVVKAKKEEFEKITWDYLKEVEALRYGTADASREQKLAELAKKRSDKMKDLSEEVRRTIEKSLGAADESVAELTLQRSGLEKELDNTRQELEFARTASSADSSKKSGIIETLKARREASATELGELEKLLPSGE